MKITLELNLAEDEAVELRNNVKITAHNLDYLTQAKLMDKLKKIVIDMGDDVEDDNYDDIQHLKDFLTVNDYHLFVHDFGNYLRTMYKYRSDDMSEEVFEMLEKIRDEWHQLSSDYQLDVI